MSAFCKFKLNFGFFSLIAWTMRFFVQHRRQDQGYIQNTWWPSNISLPGRGPEDILLSEPRGLIADAVVAGVSVPTLKSKDELMGEVPNGWILKARSSAQIQLSKSLKSGISQGSATINGYMVGSRLWIRCDPRNWFYKWFSITPHFMIQKFPFKLY